MYAAGNTIFESLGSNVEQRRSPSCCTLNYAQRKKGQLQPDNAELGKMSKTKLLIMLTALTHCSCELSIVTTLEQIVRTVVYRAARGWLLRTVFARVNTSEQE